jgi:ketosteroid isomerase-like protein
MLTEQSREAVAELRAGLEEAARGVVDAYERQDPVALAHCYAVDGVVLGPERDQARGREEIEAAARQLMEAVHFSNAGCELLECEAFGSAAYTLSRFSADTRPRPGAPAQRHSWTAFTLWKLEPSGHWRIHRRMCDVPRPVGVGLAPRWGSSIRP